MITWELARHQAAIAGRVTEAGTGRPISGARVSVTAAPAAFNEWLALQAAQYGDRWASLDERLDRTRTTPDGHFHFLDLPDGPYTLTVSLPGAGSRYGQAQAAVVVVREANGRLRLAAADLALLATTLTGTVTGPAGAPLALAEVRVTGSGERAFTDGQGRFRLAALETGRRQVSAAAAGFQPTSQTIFLNAAGVEQSVNFSLVPA